MTDRPHDEELAADLRRWFETEVHEAAVELGRSPLRPARARLGGAPERPGATRAAAGPAVALIVVVIAVVAGVSRLLWLVGDAPESEAPAASGGLTPSASTSPIPSATPVSTGVGGRYADGIPSTFDGEPVIRIPNLADAAPRDDTTFLLGAWTVDWTGITQSCVLQFGTPPPFGPRCNTRWLTDAPANGGGGSLFLDSWPTMPAGPVVVRVHRHDQRAALCEPARRNACDATAVINEIVWTGDTTTAATPITAVEAFQALGGAVPGAFDAGIVAAGPSDPVLLPLDPSGPFRSADGCLPPYPQLSWLVPGGEAIQSVLVFPTVAERERVEPNLNASGYRGTTPDGESCFLTIDGPFATEWITVENVMVGVGYLIGPTNPGLGPLAQAIEEALEGRSL